MSSSSFYRAQAERMLRQAEQAALLEKLGDLPVSSVITFTTNSDRGPSRYRLSWAARLIHVDDNPRRPSGDYWYCTSSVDTDPLRTDQFISWLMSHEVDDVEVVVSTVALQDWQPPKQTHDGTPSGIPVQGE